MNKKDLIKLVEEIGIKVGNNKFDLFNDKGESKIGNNQFREIAGICRNAECIEEIKLLIEYNISKAKQNKSWAYKIGNVSFGDLIIEKLNKIEKESEEGNQKGVLNNYSLFFGYVYWQARIWGSKSISSKSFDNKNSNGGKR